MQNPLIVPVKVLKGHKVVGELGRLTVTPFGISLRDEVKQYCTSLCRKLSHLFFFNEDLKLSALNSLMNSFEFTNRGPRVCQS